MELREERLKKRFELPPFLKHFATNLNLLARQDKLPPVFGRDKEIQQVLEILCHRERANSVMLIGEPGVGKTAIAEGLARRIEFEPESVPVRLRDCQVVNLQMNTMVAGTMLRGMFEDRIQNVIRELKERPNLILFVDEAHTMVGAGSALGAPSDAANVFKSVLARGEIRMVARDHAQRIQGIHPGRRGAGAPLPVRARCASRPIERNAPRSSTTCARGSSATTRCACSTRRSRPRSSCRRATCGISTCPDKVIGWLDTAAVRAEIDRRWEVDERKTSSSVISHVAQIPEDMVFRDVTDRFKDIEERLQARVVGQQQRDRARSRGGSC